MPATSPHPSPQFTTWIHVYKALHRALITEPAFKNPRPYFSSEAIIQVIGVGGLEPPFLYDADEAPRICVVP